MTKLEFLESLEKGLSGLPKNDIDERIAFYSEIIDDRIEEGLSEEDAVSKIGKIDEVISQIIADTPINKLVKEKIKPKRNLRVWEIILLILGSPIWLSLFIAFFAVILSIYVAIWSIVIALWSVFVSVVACAFGAVLSGIGFAVGTDGIVGIAMIGAALFSAESMDFSVSTGDINIKNANSKDKINIKVSTGHAELTDVNCGNLETKGSTGDIYLKNVIASKDFHIERSTGNIKFDGCDATEIFIKTDTGHIKGGLLSEKVFIARSDTGKIDVPKTATGGRCEVETDTGDIKINIQR